MKWIRSVLLLDGTGLLAGRKAMVKGRGVGFAVCVVCRCFHFHGHILRSAL